MPSPQLGQVINSPLNIDVKAIKSALEECLVNMQGSSKFAFFEHPPKASNPWLYLKNGGVISLPLSDRNATLFTAASHAAPFEKGEEKIVDASVRKTWQLSPAGFELRNPKWQDFLDSVVKKKGSAELYQMLLYDEGAMFKAHQDSKKAPRMFATLVIALPSEHEGEARVTHAGKTKVFETSQYSEFDCSYLVWFADVTHEVQPARAGRRLDIAELRALLHPWKDATGRNAVPVALSYLLGHQYTNASFCYDGLKGHATDSRYLMSKLGAGPRTKGWVSEER